MVDMSYIGFMECDECSTIVYIKKPTDVDIWYHPDDPQPLAEVKCTNCSNVVQDRLAYDHFSNFRRRGCAVKDWNDRFEPFTDEDINNWDIEAEFASF